MCVCVCVWRGKIWNKIQLYKKDNAESQIDIFSMTASLEIILFHKNKIYTWQSGIVSIHPRRNKCDRFFIKD